MNKIKICYKSGQDEITEKKSRFIANISPVRSEDEALSFIERVKKKYYDARHNCYAFRLCAGTGISKQSDDGEPSSTAGRPILEILEKENITDICVVVSRYFGGTLLGTGGLIRAYSEACKKGIENSAVAYKNPGFKLIFKLDYNFFGKFRYIIEEYRICILDTVYAENIELSVLVPKDTLSVFLNKITEESSGSLSPVSSEEISYLSSLDGEFLGIYEI